MEITLIWYPKCSTCQKAAKWLEETGVTFSRRDIKEQNPSAEELERWWKQSGLPLKKFINTSGLLYKSMNLKEKLPAMQDAEILSLLGSDGMLVKRPILLCGEKAFPGFRESEWEKLLRNAE